VLASMTGFWRPVSSSASEPIGTVRGVRRSVIRDTTQFMPLILDIPGYQLLLILPSTVACWPYFVIVLACWWLGDRINSQ
jgi:hypothetical protein